MVRSLFDAAFRLAEDLAAFDRTAIDFGTGNALTKAEIHAIEAIGDYAGAHMTELARHLGVTRGAFSQVVNRLEAKKLVVKEAKPGSNKKVLLKLTRTGQRAFAGHQELHARMYRFFRETFPDASRSHLRLVMEMLEQLRDCITRVRGSLRDGRVV